MTNEFAIKVLTELKGYGDKFANIGFDRKEAIDMAIKALEQEPCEDCVSRNSLLSKLDTCYKDKIRVAPDNMAEGFMQVEKLIKQEPSVTPKYTDEEIQKMQELEQAQLEKAYELGKTESFEDWLSSFNTDSATKCFTAVQELKKRLESEE